MHLIITFNFTFLSYLPTGYSGYWLGIVATGSTRMSTSSVTHNYFDESALLLNLFSDGKNFFLQAIFRRQQSYVLNDFSSSNFFELALAIIYKLRSLALVLKIQSSAESAVPSGLDYRCSKFRAVGYFSYSPLAMFTTGFYCSTFLLYGKKTAEISVDTLGA